VAETPIEYGDSTKSTSIHLRGYFVEVGVDAATAEIRVRRMLAGLAPRAASSIQSARSQVIVR